MTKWNDIRANWVNGNCKDATADLYSLSLPKALNVVRSALIAHLQNLPNGASRSGDLIDLIEIINFYQKQNENKLKRMIAATGMAKY